MAKNKGGRPTIMTEETIRKLEYAFSIGCSDREACLHAGIVPSTLYVYQENQPEFKERKELLKEKLVLKSREVVNHKIASGDDMTAKWYLERKKKDEFSTKVENDNVNVNVDANKFFESLDDGQDEPNEA